MTNSTMTNSSVAIAMTTTVVTAEKALVVGSTPLPANIAGTAAYWSIALVAMSVRQVAPGTSDQPGRKTHH